jgi:hypothetical protein
VSADGSVVVGYGSGSSGREAFRWTAAGGMVGLSDLPGGTFYGAAWGVSADGLVVVGDSNSSSGSEAFRWTSAGGMRSVRDILVNDYGLGGPLAGWTLSQANACSADGSVIVGSGTNPAGYNEAWVARLDGPPRVLSVQVNGGEAQRSRVTSVAVTFDQPVTFPGLPADAFQLRRQSDNTIVNLAASINNTGPGTVVTLTFTGGAVQFGSLADGRYTLTIDGALVSNANGALDGNGDGTAGDDFVLASTGTSGVFRLFGDSNGDATVNSTDFASFRTVFGLGASIFDFNNDGQTNAGDFAEFRKRFGITLAP